MGAQNPLDDCMTNDRFCRENSAGRIVPSPVCAGQQSGRSSDGGELFARKPGQSLEVVGLGEHVETRHC